MPAQIPLPKSSLAHSSASRPDAKGEILPDVAYLRTVMVNVVFLGPARAGDRGWTLVDAGLAGSASSIRRAAAARFGEGARPASIILTHGHFDHVGALKTLAEAWGAPIYAHPREMPYLNGTSSYPSGDPSVGGGLMAALSSFYPTRPIDVRRRLHGLPEDGSLPNLPGWRWLHTPGHSVGHVSLWRESDRTLVAGDAFVTTGQESALAVATQRAEMHGPPTYFTIDWAAAEASVRTLAGLQPEVVIAGHGRPMQGREMRAALADLAERFRAVAVPPAGKYVARPLRAEDGAAYV